MRHRKTVRHFHEPGDLHELTFSCVGRRPLLTSDLWRKLLCRSIDRAVERNEFRTVAFVLMPEHVHLVVFPTTNPGRIDDLLAAIKQPFSVRIRRILEEHGSPLLERLTVQERPGSRSFRFWQAGPGDDRNLSSEKAVGSSIESIHENPVRRGLVRTATDREWSSARGAPRTERTSIPICRRSAACRRSSGRHRERERTKSLERWGR